MSNTYFSTFPLISKNCGSEPQFFGNTYTKTILFCFVILSSWGSSKAGGGGGPQLHSTKGDVALSDARQAARSNPWLPGSLCTCGKWRVTGPAPHQGRHAGRCPGMTISQFPQYISVICISQKKM